MTQPAYLRIADDLRQQIRDGRLEPGAKLPSRHQLAATYSVSDGVAVNAVRVLVGEGAVVSRSGSGTYVRERPPLRRLTRSWYRDQRRDSPFRADMAAQSRSGGWESSSETVAAPPEIADRLALEPGGQVMRTHYVFTADGDPVMLSTSWEPLILTGGTDVMMPEDGPYAGRGVVERMRAIGVEIRLATEIVTARAVLADEARELGTAIGSTVIVIQRTYTTDERPVETANIVVPVDRYELAYVIPVDPA
ncbi:GntR family transcriptional regulator [Actinocorallia lasiicapitis]